jgi:hypothetical protein
MSTETETKSAPETAAIVTNLRATRKEAAAKKAPAKKAPAAKAVPATKTTSTPATKAPEKAMPAGPKMRWLVETERQGGKDQTARVGDPL